MEAYVLYIHCESELKKHLITRLTERLKLWPLTKCGPGSIFDGHQTGQVGFLPDTSFSAHSETRETPRSAPTREIEINKLLLLIFQSL